MKEGFPKNIPEYEILEIEKAAKVLGQEIEHKLSEYSENVKKELFAGEKIDPTDPRSFYERLELERGPGQIFSVRKTGDILSVDFLDMYTNIVVTFNIGAKGVEKIVQDGELDPEEDQESGEAVMRKISETKVSRESIEGITGLVSKARVKKQG